MVHWDNVNEFYIECNDLYQAYLKAGYSSSKVAMSKTLYLLGIISGSKKIDGRTVNVYIGIKNILN